MYPPGYHHNDFVATHSLRHMMYGYKLLVLMNQECSTSKTSRLINKARERDHIVFIITYVLHPTCSDRPWALCISWITYHDLYYAPCFVCWAFLVHRYQQCVTLHHAPKCMSCKAIVVITWRENCFHDYIYITPIFLQQGLLTLFVVDHLWPLILRPLLCLLSTAGSLVPATCNRTSCAQLLELLKSHCCDNWEDRLFPWLHRYYANLALSGFEQCVCRVSLMVTHFTLLVLLPAICNSTSSCAQVLWGTKMPLWW